MNSINLEKVELHSRNKNRFRYDLDAMIVDEPELGAYILINKHGDQSIDFSDSPSVRALNKAILKHYYGIKFWEFPKENLCPAVPGRAEYIHHMADLLGKNNSGEIPKGKKVTCLDIGVGASCIYPIIGVVDYDWNFIASDISLNSVRSSKNIVNRNPQLRSKVVIKQQDKSHLIFQGLIAPEDKIDLTICNPPFHSSIEEAQKGNLRKTVNLTNQRSKTTKLNFSGNTDELVTKGGEFQFISNMIAESSTFSKNCLWFSVLVSKEANMKQLSKLLNQTYPAETRVISIKTGNKNSRVLAWTFHSIEEQKKWHQTK